ncbi:jg1279 [Pararge aegeria aegeria]|uniref:Jg1279 protein n=1 Tax=Pararge aegeria aegeria TaxID=348720 RepID=A0A8S4QTA6_9NEOP|nr:jg1279 [Pararge aegeria aegeria]
MNPATTCDTLNIDFGTGLGVDQFCAYQCGAAIAAPWDPHVHPFSDVPRPLPLQLRDSLSYLSNSGSYYYITTYILLRLEEVVLLKNGVPSSRN